MNNEPENVMRRIGKKSLTSSLKVPWQMLFDAEIWLIALLLGLFTVHCRANKKKNLLLSQGLALTFLAMHNKMENF